VQSSTQIIITNKPTSIFYRPDAPPVAQPTVLKHLRENKYHIPWTCLPQAHLGVFQFKGQCIEKTKTMQIDDKQTMITLIVSQLDIQTVDQFIYLGCILTEGGDE